MGFHADPRVACKLHERELVVAFRIVFACELAITARSLSHTLAVLSRYLICVE